MTEEATFYSEAWRRFLMQSKVRIAFNDVAFHISIAYYNDTVPSAAIAQRLAQFRGLTLPPFAVTAISLVATRQPTQAYFQWEVLGRFALGPALTL